MATGDLLVSEFQIELNGLLLGDGTPYGLTQVDGLDLPPMRHSNVDRSSDHGAWEGLDLLSERTVTATIDIGPEATAAAFETDRMALAAIMVPRTSDIPLAFMRGGVKYLVNVRPSRFAMSQTTDYMFRLAPAAIELIAADPRIYALAQQSATTTISVSTGGLSTVLTTVLLTAGTSASGTVSVTNAGSFGARPVITITGPSSGALNGFRITNTTQSAFLDFPSLVLSPGDSLVIDTDAKSVVLNGQASRRGSLGAGSTWFELTPGVVQSITLTGADSSNTSLMSVAWRNAYL